MQLTTGRKCSALKSLLQSHVLKERVTSKFHHKITTCYLLVTNVQGKLLVLRPCFCDPNVCMCQLFILFLNRLVSHPSNASHTEHLLGTSALGVGHHMCPALLCSSVCSDVKGPQRPWQNPGRATVRFHVVQTCFFFFCWSSLNPVADIVQLS